MLVFNDSRDTDRSVRAQIGETVLDDADIRHLELLRARRSLAYLKDRIGNDAMRDLLADDLDATTADVRGWVQESSDEWQSGALEMSVPGPRAQYFEDWFMGNMKDRHEPLFRSGHPDHFLNHPTGPGQAEVIENLGEDERPWHLFLEFTDTSFVFPTAWDPSYTNSFGALIMDRDGLHTSSAMHELRDGDGALEVKLTIHLPKAAPEALVDGHLRHFSIEFRNWTEIADKDSRQR